MTLEILTEKSATSPKKGEIVLIHGACMGAWCWMDNFLPWFAAAGYDTHAVSLQNHGNSEKKGSLRMKSIKAYVEDLRQVVDKLQEPVHLIGHSMGGLIARACLERPRAVRPDACHRLSHRSGAESEGRTNGASMAAHAGGPVARPSARTRCCRFGR